MDPLLERARASGVSRETWKEAYEFEAHAAVVGQVATDRKVLARLAAFLEME